MLNYKYLLFDADGTLYDFKASERIALEEVFKHYGIPYTQENIEVYHQANARCWKEFEKDVITMAELKPKRFADFFSLMGIDLTLDEAEEASRIYTEGLAEEGIMIEGAIEVLEKLYGKYELVMITNGIANVQRGRIHTSNTGHFYKDIIISEEIGVQKPKKDFFDITLERIDAASHECLVIGDSLSSDILGGVNSNIDTLYLHLGTQAEGDRIWTYDAASYEELLDLLN